MKDAFDNEIKIGSVVIYSAGQRGHLVKGKVYRVFSDARFGKTYDWHTNEYKDKLTEIQRVYFVADDNSRYRIWSPKKVVVVG